MSTGDSVVGERRTILKQTTRRNHSTETIQYTSLNVLSIIPLTVQNKNKINDEKNNVPPTSQHSKYYHQYTSQYAYRTMIVFTALGHIIRTVTGWTFIVCIGAKFKNDIGERTIKGNIYKIILKTKHQEILTLSISLQIRVPVCPYLCKFVYPHTNFDFFILYLLNFFEDFMLFVSNWYL